MIKAKGRLYVLQRRSSKHEVSYWRDFMRRGMDESDIVERLNKEIKKEMRGKENKGRKKKDNGNTTLNIIGQVRIYQTMVTVCIIFHIQKKTANAKGKQTESARKIALKEKREKSRTGQTFSMREN